MQVVREVQAHVDVHAPADVVWDVLTDFAALPSWNPFIRGIDGDLGPGARLTVRLRVYGRRTITFRPRITVIDAPHQLQWRARTGAPGLMDVSRGFAITPGDEGGVRFSQWERCSGVLVPLLFGPGRLGERLIDGYEQMNRALRERAEAKTGALAGR